MKHVLTVCLFLLGFIALFLVKHKTVPAGPEPDVQGHDPLGIQQAFYQPVSNSLALVAGNRWAQLDLNQVAAANPSTDTIFPKEENKLHWLSFRDGAPTPADLQGMVKVELRINEQVDFRGPIQVVQSYSDGKANPVIVGPNDRPRLYLGQADPVRISLSSDVPSSDTAYLKSYVLIVAKVQPNQTNGIQFFYDPDYQSHYFLSGVRGNTELLFVPAYLGLLVLVELAISDIGIVGMICAGVLASALCFASIWVVFLVRAFSTSGNGGSGSPVFLMAICIAIISVIVGLKLVIRFDKRTRPK